MGATLSKLFYREKTITGIDIGQTAIKVMSLDSHKGEVTCFGSVDVDAEKIQAAITDGSADYIIDALGTLLSKRLIGTLGSRKVAVSIPAAYTYTRTLTLPVKAEHALRSAVELEAEQYIPVPLEGLTVDYEIISRTATDIDVLVCAAPRTVTALIVAAIEKVGLDVVAIEPSVMSVVRLLRKTEDASLPTVIVDIGAVVTDIAAIDHGKVRVTGSVPIGGSTFTLAIARAMDLSLEQAHGLKVLYGLNLSAQQAELTDAITPDLDRIAGEVRKLIRYYNDRLGGAKIEQLLIVGSGAGIPGIGDYFTNALVVAARVANPWQHLSYGRLDPPARQVKPRYITVAGVASISNEELWK